MARDRGWALGGATTSDPCVPGSLSRRMVLNGAAAWAAAAATVPALAAADDQPFDFEQVKSLARQAARQNGSSRMPPLAGAFTDMTYDAYRRVEFRRDAAMWRGEERRFLAHFFHRGSIFTDPVALAEIIDGEERPIAYDPSHFRFHSDALAAAADDLPADAGYAGFRLLSPLNRPDKDDELIAFLGATYYRALGRGNIYGLSARGLAINTGLPSGEEFPAFTRFWLERPIVGAGAARVLALMESRSATGAYAFQITPGASTAVEVEATIYARRRMDRLGVAPLTSMYAFGENDRVDVDDFRPEVHDSDGLQIRTGRGEWLWRPLMNPDQLIVSSFVDRGPRGFGLLQRDRAFASYQDTEALYERRPSAWVEPLDDWGPGAVRLLEIPTPNETQDNIVAMWTPEGPVSAGEERTLRYRVHWGMSPLAGPEAARVVATRTGHLLGRRNDPTARKFVVDFEGGLLPQLPADSPVTAEVTVTDGERLFAHAVRLPDRPVWRAFFDIGRQRRETVLLRCFLALGDAALTETWSYQWS